MNAYGMINNAVRTRMMFYNKFYGLHIKLAPLSLSLSLLLFFKLCVDDQAVPNAMLQSFSLNISILSLNHSREYCELLDVLVWIYAHIMVSKYSTTVVTGQCVQHLAIQTFILAMFGTSILSSSPMTSFNTKELVVGKKLQGFSFRSFIQVSAKQCWSECDSRPKCASFNYGHKLTLCELSTNTTEQEQEDGIVADPGYVFGEVQVCKEEISLY